MKLVSQKSYRAALLSAVVLLGGLSLAGAQDSQSNPQPDNTRMNQGDGSKGAVTADQQAMNPADRETTKQIRRAIMKDKSISMYGHNVKIITQNGMVTLKGPVRSEEEKQSIEAKAVQVAGPDKVTDNLEVKEK
jgi:osmotically-inducible protein OsmY